QRAEAISLGSPGRLAIRSSNCFTCDTTRIASMRRLKEMSITAVGQIAIRIDSNHLRARLEPRAPSAYASFVEASHFLEWEQKAFPAIPATGAARVCGSPAALLQHFR